MASDKHDVGLLVGFGPPSKKGKGSAPDDTDGDDLSDVGGAIESAALDTAFGGGDKAVRKQAFADYVDMKITAALAKRGKR